MKKQKCLKKGIAALLTLAMVAGTVGCGKQENNVFAPRLDTDQHVVLNTTGFFGNFEALDQVTNDFNTYYPNVEFSYEQVSGESFESYMEANPTIDIIMTSEELYEKLGSKMNNYCANLEEEDINLSDIDSEMLQMGYHDGVLSSIPMGQNIYGMVVNVSLLEKEGLSVPTNYDEFLDVLAALKDKGYTPIQGPDSKVYAELTLNMAFDLILSDKKLAEQVQNGDSAAVEKLQPVLEKLETIIDNGYTDMAVNQTYPADNYDEAILRFFEGDVPFWVCNSEKVSGMKKRETKSEAFQQNPFEYEFMYSPLGDKGAYALQEPWFGFAANPNGENYEYALEFLRFLATKDEINTIADIKGIPSVALEKTEETVYQNVLKDQKVEQRCINDGTITAGITSCWYTSVNSYASGAMKTPKETMEYFVALCGELK